MKDHPATIKVLNAKLTEGNCLMTCDLLLCGYVTLIGCRLWRRKEDGSRFLGLPQRSYEAEGETRYAHTVKLGESALKAATRATIAEHDRLSGGGQQAIPEADPFAE